MESRTIASALYGWVVLAVAIGSVLIVFGTALMARIGTVIIILGLVSLMPAFKYLWWEDGSDVAVESVETGEAVESVEATEERETS